MSADPISASFGRPIRGPSAFGGDTRRFISLTWVLAFTEFKLRFFGSMLGYLWQLVRPLMLFGVLFVVFNRVLRVGRAVDFYPVVLLTNIVLYTFYAEVTGGSVSSVVDREGLVRKIQFPRLVIPLSLVVTGCLNLLLNLVAVTVFMVASGVSFRLTVLEAPLLLLALAGFGAGTAMIVSAMFVRFRDVKPIWDVVIQSLYFGTPVIYVYETIADRTHFVHLVMSNPLAVILTQFRHAVIDPHAPNALTAVGGWGWMAIPIGLFVGVIVFGVWYFDRQAPYVAEEL